MKSFNATVFVFAVLSGFASRNALLAQETANLQSEHTKTVESVNPLCSTAWRHLTPSRLFDGILRAIAGFR